MIPGVVGEVFVRGVPAALQAGLSSGDYALYGSVIREVGTGRIVGFLQEAAPFLEVASSLPLGPVSAVVQAAGFVAEQVQMAELADNVQTLMNLAGAGLGLDVVSLGLTAAGIAVLMAKIETLRGEVRALAERVDGLDQKLDQLRQDAVDQEFANLVAVARGYDEGWRLTSGAEARWHREAAEALRLQLQFERRATQAMGDGVAGYAIADPLLDAVAFAGGLRVSSLAACNQAAAAMAAAAETARMLERITGGIGLADLSRADLANVDAEPGGPGWSLAQARARAAARTTAARLRQREALALTRAAPLPLLEARGVSPRQWLIQARAENEAPILTVVAD